MQHIFQQNAFFLYFNVEKLTIVRKLYKILSSIIEILGGKEMAEKRMVQKKRIFEIVQQLEHLGPNVDVKRFIEVVKSIKHIKKYALIVHDKDVDNKFEPVAPHIHCVVVLDNANNMKTVSGWFLEKNVNVNEFNIEFAKGRLMHMLAYLTHENAPEKHQYSDGEVVSNFEWKKEAEKIQYADLENVISMIEEGRIREYNKTDFINIHMMVNNQLQLKRAFEWREQKRISEIRKGGGDMAIDVVYIEGESGAGKSTYAKMLCEEKGYSYCVSSSANDPLQDYAGQDALILDDLRGTTMTASDLLKLLDNHTRSSVRSRYNNKWLYECKLIIITSVFSLKEFFESLKGNEKEPIEQLKRRCETRIKMTKDRIVLYSYNPKTMEYEALDSVKNTVIEKFEEQQEKKRQKSRSFLLGSLQDEYIYRKNDHQ